MLAEIDLMQTFHHPNVIKFFTALDLGGLPCVVMELCTGGSYWDALQREVRSLETQAALAKGVQVQVGGGAPQATRSERREPKLSLEQEPQIMSLAQKVGRVGWAHDLRRNPHLLTHEPRNSFL
jgi:serine/threonine protein kinase